MNTLVLKWKYLHAAFTVYCIQVSSSMFCYVLMVFNFNFVITIFYQELLLLTLELEELGY